VQFNYTEPGLIVPEAIAIDPNDVMTWMWYVSVPFKVVCMMDQVEDEDKDENAYEAPPRQCPLLAVDFGHMVWSPTQRVKKSVGVQRTDVTTTTMTMTT